ncbi:hypothetical protein [Sphingopyxis sp.]|uniref:hypothetical protein n=1 Tax=Sphingopyxis sp. TaxID=1908224 RepID=UPI001DF59CAD|nr:hypothetical protein [Sphingopyxis sp.]MBW8295380.1 hypothetical protein [Sphingopyxis sp.]
MTEDKMKREIGLQDYEAQSAEALARLQYQVDYSKALLSALTIGNGGAIIALLTFIGNTGSKVDPASMQGAFGVYGTGLACVLVAYACGFFTQLYFYNVCQMQAWNGQAEALGTTGQNEFEADMKKGNFALVAGIVAAIASLACFVGASLMALNAIT